MTFRVGMKVVCVGPFVNPLALGEVHPAIGEVYTVRDLLHYDGACGLYLQEIRNPKKITAIGLIERPFTADRFRPAVSPKVEISFTTGADPDSEQYDNRRRIPVSEWGCSA